MMWLYKDTRLMIFILLVAKCKQQVAVAYGGPIYEGPGVRSSFNHREYPAAHGSPGTEEKSQAHIESRFTRNIAGDGKSDLRGESSISDERKHQIEDKLKENEQPIKLFQSALNSLRTSIQEFEDDLKRELKNYAEFEESKKIWGNLCDLKSFHKHYFSSLIRDRLYKLGGIGSSMVGIGPGPGKNEFGLASSTAFQDKDIYRLDDRHASKNPRLVPVDVSQEQQNTPPRGERAQKKQMPDLFAEKSEVRPNEQDGQEASNSQVLTKLRTEKPLPETRELPEDLSKFISNRARLGMVQDLQEILHRSVLKNLHQYHIDFQTKWLHLKTSSEKLVFETLEFLSEYHLITKEEYQSFFRSPQTIKFIARHSSELYKAQNRSFFAFHAVMLERGVLIGTLETDHLKRLLNGIDKRDMKDYLYEVLKIAIQDLDAKSGREDDRIPELLRIIEVFCNENFLNALDQWPSPKAELPGHLLSTTASSAIKLHQNFPEFSEEDSIVKSFEFMINLCILKFMKTHGNEDLKKLISQQTDPSKPFAI